MRDVFDRLRYHTQMHSSAAARKRLTTWLALLAMWLLVCVPTVSQMVAAHEASEPVAELCSGSTASAVQQEHPAATLAKCGYCDFVGTHPVLPALAAAVLSSPALAPLAVAALFDAFIPVFSFQAGHPRDPPRRA
ncbi:MAG TPA: DUF2946 family protein [Paraburkholderia sp.]|uniref:DUF2946 family protein n=1 Tax=Paraburkholderia sp. TaxID=1926495 RepID=UPI002CDC2B31|nr:DUF2946 family protein [Paraburkholderia sp.]HTR08478.1 DUF2946 family protein [Paraburkholderia sp.]